jgi:hypothetical protein
MENKEETNETFSRMHLKVFSGDLYTDHCYCGVINVAGF